MKQAEISFPRGKPTTYFEASTGSSSGKIKKKKSKEIVTSRSFIPRDPSDDLFKVSYAAAPAKTGKKKKKTVLTSEETDLLVSGSSSDKTKSVIDVLSYETITEGMLSLGRVIKVREHEILVSLPGRTMGSVPITAISGPYTKALEKLTVGGEAEDPVYGVKDLFQVGQVVSVAVTGVKKNGHSFRVTLSLAPNDIQAAYNTSCISESTVLTGAVESVEDYGYIIDVGIPGAHAFLPKDNAKSFIQSVNHGKPLGIGQLLKCKVLKSKATGKSGTNKNYLTLTINPKDINRTRYTLETVSNYELLLPGMESNGTVMETHKTGVKVDFLDMVGHIHLDHMADVWSLPGSLEIGATVFPRVLYLLPNSTNPYLTIQSSLCQKNATAPQLTVTLGEKVKVKIARIEKRGLIVRFEKGERGFVSSTRCSDNSEVRDEDIAKEFPVGSSHECCVLEHSSLDNMYICSFQQSVLNQPVVRSDQLKPGQVVSCVLKSWNLSGAIVGIGLVKGFIPKIHFGELALKNPAVKYPVGHRFKARVCRVDLTKNHVMLTAKKRLVKSEFPILSSYEECVYGLASEGVVSKVTEYGLFVFTIGGLPAFIPASKATAEVRTRLTQLFLPGQVVKFNVIDANQRKNRLLLSLMFDEANPRLFNVTESVIPGEDKEKQKIKKSGEVSLTVKTDGSLPDAEKKLKKRRKSDSEVSSNAEAASGSLPPADLKKSNKKRRTDIEASAVVKVVNGSLPTRNEKKSNKKRQEDPEVSANAEMPNESLSNVNEKNSKKKRKSDSKVTSAKKKTKKDSVDLKADEEVVEPPKKKKKKNIEVNSKKEAVNKKTKVEVPCLEFPGQSFYDTSYLIKNEETDSELSSDEEKEKKEHPKAQKRIKKAKGEEEWAKENEIRKVEAKLADPTNTPTTVEDFERLVLASPNSSMAWSAYIAFVLQGADVESARKIAARALKSILFREEGERENIWKVSLNMEAEFGTEESLKNTFNEALKANEPLAIYKTMCDIYERAKNYKELEHTLRVMTKKFPNERDVWFDGLSYFYKVGELDKGRELFKSSLEKLPKTEHITMISKTAVLEMKYGDLEKGRTLLETTLRTYPKRLDIWLLYTAQLIKKGEHAMAREVFQNAAQVPFVPKRMLTVLKKFLQFELDYGTIETRAKVKEIALQYVNSVDASASFLNAFGD